MVVVNKIHPEYVSGGCNHSAHALDADYSQNVIVYASNKNVFELHISSGGVATILGDGVGAGGSDAKERHHEAPVTCVKIVEKKNVSSTGCDDENNTNAVIVLSADASGTVIAWEAVAEKEDARKRKWIPRANNEHSFGPITQIAAKRETSDSVIVATVAADDYVRLWNLNVTNWTMEQVGEKAFPSQHRPMCVDVSDRISSSSSITITTPSSSSSRFVAVGCADGTTRVYAVDTKAATDFEFITELVGHDDWVRDAKFQSLTSDSDSDGNMTLYLATCSQDKNARVWKIVTRNDTLGESESTNTRLPFETLAAPPRPPLRVVCPPPCARTVPTSPSCSTRAMRCPTLISLARSRGSATPSTRCCHRRRSSPCRASRLAKYRRAARSVPAPPPRTCDASCSASGRSSTRSPGTRRSSLRSPRAPSRRRFG